MAYTETTATGKAYSLTCTRPTTVYAEIDGETATVCVLPQGGTAVFIFPSAEVTVETEGPYRLFPTNAAISTLDVSGGGPLLVADAAGNVRVKMAYRQRYRLSSQTKHILLEPSSQTGLIPMQLVFTPAQYIFGSWIECENGCRLEWLAEADAPSATDVPPSLEGAKEYVVTLVQLSPDKISATMNITQQAFDFYSHISEQ